MKKRKGVAPLIAALVIVGAAIALGAAVNQFDFSTALTGQPSCEWQNWTDSQNQTFSNIENALNAVESQANQSVVENLRENAEFRVENGVVQIRATDFCSFGGGN